MKVNQKGHGLEVKYQWASLSNTLLNSVYDLNIVEKNIILMILGNISSKQEGNNDWYTMSIDDYALMRGISKEDAYHVLKVECNRLFDRYILIKDWPKKGFTAKLRWVQAVSFNKEDRTVMVKWSDDIMPFLFKLKDKFTELYLEEVIPIDSKYTARLWDLLSQHRYQGLVGSKAVDIQWLIATWHIPESCRELKFLKSKVLKPAIRELDARKLGTVTIRDGKKEGRKVTELIFDYTLKDKPKKLCDVLAEAKVGGS